MKYTIQYFKKNIEPNLDNFIVEYKKFPNGDLGPLEEIVIRNSNIEGVIDYWELDYFGVFLYDYTNKKEIINVLLDPEQENEKDKLFEIFLYHISK